MPGEPDRDCQLCGARSFAPLLRVEAANFSSRITAYSIFRCTRCDLATMFPFPTESDVRELYVQEGVFSVRAPNPYAGSWAFRVLEPLYQKHGTDLRFIARQCLALAGGKGARVVDFGCSIGRLLDAFANEGPVDAANLTGIDIDPKAKSNGIDYLRERIVIGDFLTMDLEQPCDVLTMRFVIEHLLDFKAHVAKALSMLRPGGILFISTPDIDSAQARQLGERWKLINDPAQKIGHLRWFNRRSAEFMAAQFGLRLEKLVHRGELLYHLPAWLQSSLRKLLGVDPGSGRYIKRYAPRIINATVFDGVLSHTLDYGDALYAFLRKP